MKIIPLLCFAAVFFLCCSQDHREGSFSAEFMHQPLNEFADSIREIPSPREIELLAYSGGDVEKKGDRINYCQFIGVDEGIRNATLRAPTDDDKMVLDLMPGLQDGKRDPSKPNSGLEGAVAKEYVMVPKDVPFFARHFKTYKGILSFKEQPW